MNLVEECVSVISKQQKYNGVLEEGKEVPFSDELHNLTFGSNSPKTKNYFIHSYGGKGDYNFTINNKDTGEENFKGAYHSGGNIDMYSARDKSKKLLNFDSLVKALQYAEKSKVDSKLDSSQRPNWSKSKSKLYGNIQSDKGHFKVGQKVFLITYKDYVAFSTILDIKGSVAKVKSTMLDTEIVTCWNLDLIPIDVFKKNYPDQYTQVMKNSKRNFKYGTGY